MAGASNCTRTRLASCVTWCPTPESVSTVTRAPLATRSMRVVTTATVVAPTAIKCEGRRTSMCRFSAGPRRRDSRSTGTNQPVRSCVTGPESETSLPPTEASDWPDVKTMRCPLAVMVTLAVSRSSVVETPNIAATWSSGTRSAVPNGRIGSSFRVSRPTDRVRVRCGRVCAARITGTRTMKAVARAAIAWTARLDDGRDKQPS